MKPYFLRQRWRVAMNICVLPAERLLVQIATIGLPQQTDNFFWFLYFLLHCESFWLFKTSHSLWASFSCGGHTHLRFFCFFSGMYVRILHCVSRSKNALLWYPLSITASSTVLSDSINWTLASANMRFSDPVVVSPWSSWVTWHETMASASRSTECSFPHAGQDVCVRLSSL